MGIQSEVGQEQAAGCTSRLLSYLPCSSSANASAKRKETNESIVEHESRIQEMLDEQKRNEWVEARMMHDKISSRGDHFVFAHGPIEDFHRGLSSFLGAPKKLLYEAMEEEFCDSDDSDLDFCAGNYGIITNSRIEWHFVIDPSEKSLKKLNCDEWPSETTLDPNDRRKCRTIDSFDDDLAQTNVKLHRLGMPSMTIIEVIALRLYSGPIGSKLNKMLRARIAGHREGQEWRLDEERKLCLGNKYTTTIHVIQSAISKLGKINPNEKGYWGGNNMVLNERFWTNHPDLHCKGGVEGGFMSVTTNRSVAEFYARLKKGRLGVILEVDMSTMDRGAELNWIAQYPHEKETLLPPLTYLHVEHIHIDQRKDNPMMIVEARARISQSIKVQMPLLTDAENALMRQVIKEEINSNVITNSELLSRFCDEENFLVTGNPMESVLGLSYFLGAEDHEIQSAKVKGIGEIEREILASGEDEVIANMKYVLYDAASEQQFSNGIRDLNNSGKRLADFVNHPTAIKYQLREEHIAALRLYTTSAFRYINNPLRKNIQTNEQERKPHPFPVTVSFIDEAIKRLRASTAQTFEQNTAAGELKENAYLWRGIKNTRITEGFLQGRRGGTELGLMSTTRDLKIAVEYSKSLDGNGLLLKFKLDNIKQFGADVSWLSAFPTEEEILYPPLTFLQPTGRVETTTINGVAFTTVELQPHL